MQASKEVGRPIVHEFSRDALSEAGATHLVPPFSVVASNTMDLSVGRSVPCSVLFALLKTVQRLMHAVAWEKELLDATASALSSTTAVA